jgi:hypothetical protein
LLDKRLEYPTLDSILSSKYPSTHLPSESARSDERLWSQIVSKEAKEDNLSRKQKFTSDTQTKRDGKVEEAMAVKKERRLFL